MFDFSGNSDENSQSSSYSWSAAAARLTSIQYSSKLSLYYYLLGTINTYPIIQGYILCISIIPPKNQKDAFLRPFPSFLCNFSQFFLNNLHNVKNSFHIFSRPKNG